MGENILLVEGPNDGGVITGLLCKNSVIIPNFRIITCIGIENLLAKLDLYLKNSSAYNVIGVVVDADNSVESRWQQLRDRLAKTKKYDCRRMPLNIEGMVIEPMEPEDATVGFWIMPDNKYQGTLENFLLDMIPEGDELMKEVERELLFLENENLNRYKDKYRNKAKVHTYLSWEENPGCSLNTAIVSSILNSKTELANIFVGWLKKLFLT